MRIISRPSRRGGRHPPRSREDDFEAAPDEGRNTLVYCPAERDAVVVLLPASPDLGEVISRALQTRGSAPPDSP